MKSKRRYFQLSLVSIFLTALSPFAHAIEISDLFRDAAKSESLVIEMESSDSAAGTQWSAEERERLEADVRIQIQDTRLVIRKNRSDCNLAAVKNQEMHMLSKALRKIPDIDDGILVEVEDLGAITDNIVLGCSLR